MNIQALVDQDAGDHEVRAVTSWNASKVGGCLAGVYLERLGVPPLEDFDERVKRVFQCGKLFEEYVINQIKKTNVPLEEQVRIENKELGVTGYADLVLTTPEGGKEVIEVKSQNSRAFWYMVKKGEGAYEHHKMQLLLYLMTLGINEGKLVYVSKDDLCIQEFPVALDREIEVSKKLMENLRVLNHALETHMMPLPAEDGTFQAKYCRWHGYCTGKIQIPLSLGLTK